MADQRPELPDEAALALAAVGHVRRRAMDPWGLHGLAHWWRVRHNGLLVARSMGANPRVVALFAIAHDSHREHDGVDPDHGGRAASWLAHLRACTCTDALPTGEAAAAALIRGLDDSDFRSLHEACALHTHALGHSDPTVAACFVADRLDLSRVGCRPDPVRMPGPCRVLTDAFIDAAVCRQRAGLEWEGGGEIASVWGVRLAS